MPWRYALIFQPIRCEEIMLIFFIILDSLVLKYKYIELEDIVLFSCNVYKMSGSFVSMYTDTSASHDYLCTLIQNGHEFCKLLIKRPQTVMFSNYI